MVDDTAPAALADAGSSAPDTEAGHEEIALTGTFDTGNLVRFPSAVSPLTPTQTLVSEQAPDIDVRPEPVAVSDIGVRTAKGEGRTPVHQLKIARWDSVREGNGRSIRFRLSEPDPDTGAMSRYYRWIPLTQFDDFKQHFNISQVQHVETFKEKLNRP